MFVAVGSGVLVAVGGNGVFVRVGVFVGCGATVEVEVGAAVVGVGPVDMDLFNVTEITTGVFWLSVVLSKSWNWTKRAGAARAPPLTTAVHAPQATPSAERRACTARPAPFAGIAFQERLCQFAPTPASWMQLV